MVEFLLKYALFLQNLDSWDLIRQTGHAYLPYRSVQLRRVALSLGGLFRS